MRETEAFNLGDEYQAVPMKAKACWTRRTISGSTSFWPCRNASAIASASTWSAATQAAECSADGPAANAGRLNTATRAAVRNDVEGQRIGINDNVRACRTVVFLTSVGCTRVPTGQ